MNKLIKKKNLFPILFIPFLLPLSGCNEEPLGDKYIFTLDPNGGEISKNEVEVYSNRGVNLEEPTKEGKSFLGWYTGWEEDDIRIDNGYKPSKDLTLYAKWDSYDLSYLNHDDEVIYVSNVTPNSLATPINKRAKEYYDETSAYIFDHWDFNYTTRINKDYEINPVFVKEDVTFFDVTFPLYVLEDDYTFSFPFRESMFDEPSSTFVYDLACFSIGLNFSSHFVDKINNVYNTLEFDNLLIHEVEDKSSQTHDMLFSLAHKKINNNDIICLSLESMMYEKGWITNFDIGIEGNHQGFEGYVDTIMPYIKDYLSNPHFTSESTKLFITGYSRGGSVAELLNVRILEEQLLSMDNVYVYTFEAPKAVDTSNTIEYKNCFNIINSADAITHVLPDEFNLKRIGTDIDVYSENIDKIVKGFNKDIKMPTFTKNDSFPTEHDFDEFFLDILLEIYPTRVLFYNNIAKDIMNLVDIFTSLKVETITKIEEDFSKKGVAILSYLQNPDLLKEFIIPYLIEDGVSFDEEQLDATFTKIKEILTSPSGKKIISTAIVALNNFLRIAYMHYPEVNYLLLLNYDY